MIKIAIHSAPRSGSTWLGTLFDAHPSVLYKYQPLFSYEFKDYLNESSSLNEIESFYNEIRNCKSDFLDQEDAKRRGIVPHFTKGEIKAIAYKEVRYHHILENLLNKDNQIKIIGLIRDPRAVLHSWFNAPKEFDKEKWNFLDEWLKANKKNENKIENFYGYEKWKEVAILFHDLEFNFPNNFRLISYSDLYKDTEKIMEKLMSFCGLELNQQQISFIQKSKESHNSDAYSVYKIKNVDDKWKGLLDFEVLEFIKNDLKNSLLEQYIK